MYKMYGICIFCTEQKKKYKKHNISLFSKGMHTYTITKNYKVLYINFLIIQYFTNDNYKTLNLNVKNVKMLINQPVKKQEKDK